MEKLDLHGMPHYLVENDLVRTLNRLWNTNTELEVVTGNSERMKDIVMKVLREHGLEFQDGDMHNFGYIKTVV